MKNLNKNKFLSLIESKKQSLVNKNVEKKNIESMGTKCAQYKKSWMLYCSAIQGLISRVGTDHLFSWRTSKCLLPFTVRGVHIYMHRVVLFAFEDICVL
jgi:hypothetical protein